MGSRHFGGRDAMTDPHEALAVDLITRATKTVDRIADMATDTGITFHVQDVVDAVTRDLPDDYLAIDGPFPPGRDILEDTVRGVLTGIVKDILSGEMYAD